MLIKNMYEIIIDNRKEVKIEECILFAAAALAVLPFDLILSPIEIIGGIIYFFIKRGKKK